MARMAHLRTAVVAHNRLPASLGELKNIDDTTASLIVAGQTTAMQSGCLNSLAQGVTAVTRLGRRITMKSLYWLFEGSLAATSAGASPVRLLIVYDKQTNGAAMATTDVMNTDAINEAHNLGNSRRFVTLVDEFIECMGTGGPQAFFRTGYKKMNLQVEFNNGSAGTVADIQTGSVYAFVWQNGNIITANPLTSLKTRFRFSDQ